MVVSHYLLFLLTFTSLLTDDESGSDDEGATRDSIKREAHQLVELKTKKKPQDDDDEDDGKKRKRGRR